MTAGGASGAAVCCTLMARGAGDNLEGADGFPGGGRKALGLLLLGVLLALVAAPPAEAQFRVSGGYDLTSFFGAGQEGASTRASLGFGGSAALLSLGPLIVMGEAYYRQKGARNVTEFNERVLEEGSAEIGLDYIEIPVLLRVNLPTMGGRFVPYLNGGPAFGWNVNCGIRFQGETGTAEQDCGDLEGENLGETLRSYEQGFAVGGGVDIALFGGIGALNVDARLTQGLSRINERGDGVAEVRNRAFSVMLGYSFGIPGGLGIP